MCNKYEQIPGHGQDTTPYANLSYLVFQSFIQLKVKPAHNSTNSIILDQYNPLIEVCISKNWQFISATCLSLQNACGEYWVISVMQLAGSVSTPNLPSIISKQQPNIVEGKRRGKVWFSVISKTVETLENILTKLSMMINNVIFYFPVLPFI